MIVWGAIKEDWARVLVRCSDKMGFIAYEDVLKKWLQNMFQQEGAPSHNSRLVSCFSEKLKIYVLSNWPIQSPDLNIIEPLLGDLKVRVARCRTGNVEYPSSYQKNSRLHERSNFWPVNALFINFSSDFLIFLYSFLYIFETIAPFV